MDLNARQRQYLKGLAHDLAPVVRVGKARITPDVTAEADRSLDAHELVKVRVDAEGSDTRRALADDLAQRTGSSVVAVIGKVAILYRAREEDPSIRLP